MKNLIIKITILSSLLIAIFMLQSNTDKVDLDIITEASKDGVCGVCSQKKIAEIVAPATSKHRTVRIDCSLNLKYPCTITKKLIFIGSAASNITCNFNGATLNGGKGQINDGQNMIEIRSRKDGNKWIRPENITIKNCKITGSMLISGMGPNGEGEYVRESSRQGGHVSRVRKNAPKNIILDNIEITGIKGSPLYLAPGVTKVTLKNSKIIGASTGVAIYLDTESAQNTIKDNYINVTRKGSRELIAIDGSSRNKIINNRFSGLNRGGIYLYRNCGEGGTVRHTPPEHNIIINNSFYYKKYTGNNPAIYLGSRNGNRNYCGADAGFSYGSSKSNKDYARYNVIMQNQFFKKRGNNKLSNYIQYKDKKTSSPNYISHNEIVTSRKKRKAGSYVKNGYKNFIKHGESIDVFKKNGRLVCKGYKLTSNNGKLIKSSISIRNCKITEIPFECSVSGNNKGCRKNISAPKGKTIIGVKVACNLEHGSVTASELSSTKLNQMKVVKPSQNVSEGSCFIGTNKISKGAKNLSDVIGQVRLLVGCKEHDKNGGDCHVKGVLYCR